MLANTFRILTDHHTPTFQSQTKSLNLFKVLLLSTQQFQSQIQFSFIWHRFTHGAELFYLNGETLDTQTTGVRKTIRRTLVEVGEPHALCHPEVEVIFRINLTIVWMNHRAGEKVTAEGEVGAEHK